MSDPAFEIRKIPENAIAYQDVPRDPDAVYLLDFDGVIVAGVEDAIYKLPEQPGEKAILRRLASEYSILCGDMEPRYQRHLIFQEVARRTGLAIEPGPGFDLAKWASTHAKTFILTARSGWSATWRVREFISKHLHPPIEIYQLGRTSKKLQVSLLCREFWPAHVYYVEDSPSHLADAAELDHTNLKLVSCSRNVSQKSALDLYESILLKETHDV